MKFHGRVISVGKKQIQIQSEGKIQTVPIIYQRDAMPDSMADANVGDIVEIQGKSVKVLVRSQGSLDKQIDSQKFATLQNWSLFVKHIRDFFEAERFLEIRTPNLVVSPGLEPFLDPFKTVFKQGSRTDKQYLPTSPEFHLKKALCQGLERVFEIKECFRNGELSSHHQPEFTMLEWYRAYENNEAVIHDIQKMFNCLSTKLKKPRVKIKVLKMEELWKKYLGFNLTPQTSIKDLQKHFGKLDTDFDDFFTRILIDKIEPHLAEIDHPLIIWHYPPSQAALARIMNDGWADRFELYWRGMELANSFYELNDFEEQRRRFLKDQEKRQALGKEVVPIDEDFMEHLAWGMPPAAGIALGMERLFMALYGLHDIADLRLFPMR